jgi:hypothetical protein
MMSAAIAAISQSGLQATFNEPLTKCEPVVLETQACRATSSIVTTLWHLLTANPVFGRWLNRHATLQRAGLCLMKFPFELRAQCP